MAQPDEKQIKLDIADWRKLTRRVASIERKRDAELAPHDEAYEAATSSITETYDGKLSPLNDAIKAIEERVDAELQRGVSEDTESAEVTSIEGDGVEVEFITSKTVRLVSLPALFAAVKPGLRKGKGWSDCFKIQIGKLEELIGKDKVNEISIQQRTWAATIKEVAKKVSRKGKAGKNSRLKA